MPTISVISGAYNIGKCYSFRRSIESILNQTFTDFEFIICDDGSTDNTWELLSEYSDRDARIKLLKNEKMGIFYENPLTNSRYWIILTYPIFYFYFIYF